LKNVFLETANVVAFREAMNLLEDTELGQPGLGVVWGRAGRGKTVCAREYAVRTGAVYLRALEDETPRAMLSRLCFELNGSDPHTTERCKRIAVEVLEKRPRSILVDEADRMRVGLIEHFRDIHDLTGVPIVFIGEEHLHPALNSRRRIWSRVTQTVEFHPISAEDIMLFGLRAADLRIEPQAAQRIGARAGGDFRLVWSDVRELEQMARANATQNVDARMVGALSAKKPGPGLFKGQNGGGHVEAR